jgi:peptide/nickel transport system permease protein
MALFAPWLAQYEADDYTGQRMAPPSTNHLMGVDHLGRDLLSRVIYGSRISIRVGVLAVGLSLISGTILGLISGYFGRFVDNIIMRGMDVMMALPYVLLAILIASVLGPSLENAILAIGIVRIPRFARLARASTLKVKEQQYIEASRSVGAADFRIIRKDVLPNIMGPIIVYATLSLVDAILGAAVLSFLGLGAQPPIPEWGAMLNEAQKYITLAPHLSIFPGLAIFLTVLGFNLFGDGLRDILDPQSRR